MNSPLMTAVVGTSMALPRPNAPLTPTIAPTAMRAATQMRIVRLSARHMSLHRHARLQAGRDNHFVIVHRAERHRARSGAAAVEHAHDERVVVLRDGIAGH